jgi:hypothetical protein
MSKRHPGDWHAVWVVHPFWHTLLLANRSCPPSFCTGAFALVPWTLPMHKSPWAVVKAQGWHGHLGR